MKDTLINLSVLLILSLLFLLIAIVSGEIQEKYLHGSTLIKLFNKINSIVAFVIPITVFIFYIGTSFLVLQLLDYNGSIRKLFTPLAYSFSPIILYSLLYLMVLLSISEMDFSTISEIEIYEGPFGLSLKMVNSAGKIFWGAFYLLYVLLLKKLLKITFTDAIASGLLPSITVFIFKLLLLS